MAREKYPDLPSELFQTPQAAQIGRTMLEEGNGAITEYGLIREQTDGRFQSSPESRRGKNSLVPR